MDIFADFLNKIENPQHRARMEEVFEWIEQTFPQLERKVGWNQPMYTDHDTYIIGFSVSKKHMAVAPERAGMIHCAEAIELAGYDHTELLVRIPWGSAVHYDMLQKMIDFNIWDKANCTTFWRK
ncbi:iron chaperone [Paenibacillus koleovorans]|uniref:iron chaperone n=1 Tax=Paenibacillus koleovorans TaxID=121608 RepID=UPI000FD9BC62|nr:iron chaperone [Paenibacillus koleovorans]